VVARVAVLVLVVMILKCHSTLGLLNVLFGGAAGNFQSRVVFGRTARTGPTLAVGTEGSAYWVAVVGTRARIAIRPSSAATAAERIPAVAVVVWLLLRTSRKFSRRCRAEAPDVDR
jgi:hypothetical protein